MTQSDRGSKVHDPNHGTWAEWSEGLRAAALAFSVGMISIGYRISRGRQWNWLQVLIEPCVAMLAGWLIWQMCGHADIAPKLTQVFVSLSAWGGPKTIAALDKKYLRNLGGSDFATRPAPLDTKSGDNE